MKPYYYVYEYGNKSPRVRHATLEQAETEAKRLAGTSPGATFEILMAVGITRVTTPQTFWMDGVIGPSCLRDAVGGGQRMNTNPSGEISRWIEAAKTLPPVTSAGQIECRGDLRFIAIEYAHNYDSPRRAWELLDINGNPLGVTFNEEIIPSNDKL